MKTVNVHEAKTHLSKLIDLAVKGEPFIIAKAGKPLVKVMALDAPQPLKRIGFLEGQFEIPEDFDTMGAEEIERAFNGEFGRDFHAKE
jgi:prevent-host-death family protein